MHKHTLLIIATSIAACHVWAPPPAAAQGPQDWDAVSGDWNSDDNWLNGFVPDGPVFGDTALINNGGTATLTVAASAAVGGVSVGPGSLELTSLGSLSVVDATDLEPSATGFFNIGGNGSLTLSDTASVVAEGVLLLSGSTNVIGPNVSFTTQNDLQFGLASVYNATISDPTVHSVISADGIATLRGTLNVNFSGGVTPSLGDTWTLVDAPTVDGNFATINFPKNILSLGQVFGITKVAGGKGTLAQLSIQERLVLQVDRQSGSTTLLNPGNAPISIQGYTFESNIGSLAPNGGNWESLQDQAVPNWVEVPSSSNALGELISSSGGSLAISSSGGQQPLGAAFNQPLTFFGSPSPEDLVFTYRDAAEGVLQGVVEYVGAIVANNLVLTVDSTTGNAQIRNASPTTSVDLQGYTITSEDGSLLASFDSDLPDAEWDEVAGSANGVGELNFLSGSTTLAPGDTFNLTGVFSPGGSEDLVFEFRHPVFSEGDFNEDGLVNGDDLTGSALSWDQRFGDDLTGSDFLAWQRLNGTVANSGGAIVTGITQYDGSFPATAISTAIPEPSSGMISLAALLGLITLGPHLPKRMKRGA